MGPCHITLIFIKKTEAEYSKKEKQIKRLTQELAIIKLKIKNNIKLWGLAP